MVLDKVATMFGLSKFNVKRMVGEEERDIPNHEFEMFWRHPTRCKAALSSCAV